MEIGSTSNASNSTGALSGSRSTLADNFDTFLSILTTQLKNQNPLDPLDTNQFTQQLVQFSGVEQQLKSNDFLKALVEAQSTTSITDGVAFVGKEITAATSMSELTKGQASWTYDAASASDKVTVTVKDPAGNVVYSEQISMEAGKGRFDWNGKDSTGLQREDGPYQINIDARNDDDGVIAVNTQLAGTVDGVDFSSGTPVLLIGGSRVSLGAVLTVSTPKPKTTA